MIKEKNAPSKVVLSNDSPVNCYSDLGDNIDQKTVSSFGEEWEAFHEFSHEDLQRIGASYFDLVTPEMTGPDKTAADFGCGSGRWTKYIHSRFGRVAAIDPSNAIFAATTVLKDAGNISYYKASIDNLPFEDNSFDFGFSLGVLHHIPDTDKALSDCVKKVKMGGYFLVYLYYDLENRGPMFRSLYKLSDSIRKRIAGLPPKSKKRVCDVLAVAAYMPFVLVSRTCKLLGVPKKVREKIPLHSYESTSFYIIRNDSLDRFGTPLEQRFNRKQITEMMSKAGLKDIKFSEQMPYWHAIGKKAGSN